MVDCHATTVVTFRLHRLVNTMDRAHKTYTECFNKFGNTLQALLIPKGRQQERFASLTHYIKPNESKTLLDFGCGLGHLQAFLSAHLPMIDYHGCDFVEGFVAQSRINFPAGSFYHINQFSDVADTYDYIVAAGVFNVLYCSSRNKHARLVCDILQHLFQRANAILSVNFMTDDVDYVLKNAYHQNIGQLLDFSRRVLTKRFVIDQSYMPYEFTIHLFKDAAILRPDNVFRPS